MGETEKQVELKPIAPKKRELGWDLWRFWGCFTIFAGHMFLEFFYSWLGDAEVMSGLFAPTLWQELIYPDGIQGIFTMSAVPVFIFISGYFTLRKEPGANDWSSASTNFWKFIVYAWKWIALALVLLLVVPSLYPDVDAFGGYTLGQNILNVINNFVNTDAYQAGVINPVSNLIYFFVGMAWLALLSPLLRPLYHTKNVKAMRIITGVVCAYAFLLPGVRLIASGLLETFPNSLVLSFFSTLNPFSTVQFGWDNYWIACFMLGGLFAADEELRGKIKNMKWPVVAAVGVIALLFGSFASHYHGILQAFAGGSALVNYNMGGWFPLAVFYIIVSYKLNFIIRDDSKLGRFIIKFSPATLGVITAAWTFCSVLPSANLQIRASLLTFTRLIWSPGTPAVVVSLVLFAINVVLWFVFLFLVYFIMKIPYVGNMFKFTTIKFKKKAPKSAD